MASRDGGRSSGRGGEGGGDGASGRSLPWSSRWDGHGWRRDQAWDERGDRTRSGGWEGQGNDDVARWSWRDSAWDTPPLGDSVWRDTPSRSEDCNDRSGGRWDSRGRGEDDPHFYRNYVARTAALNEVARKAAPPAPPLAKTSDGAAQRPLAAHSAPAHQSTSTPAKASDGAAQRRPDSKNPRRHQQRRPTVRRSDASPQTPHDHRRHTEGQTASSMHR